MFDSHKAKVYSYASCYRCGIKFNKEEDIARKNDYRLSGTFDMQMFLCKDCSTKLVKFLEEGAEL